MLHGRITHGGQFANPKYRQWPSTYFGLESGVGRLLTAPSDHPRRVAVMGLGVGTLAAYGRPGDTFRFYEINPQMTRVAVESFTYLGDSAAAIEIIPGDGRLSMESELESGKPQNYDVIVLDAFSGDSVPIHLLTKEAFEMYLRHLAPGGVIAVNISNRYVDLTRVMAGLSKEFDLHVRILVNMHDLSKLVMASKWVLMSRDEAVLDQEQLRKGALILSPNISPILWTDEYASLVPLVQWSGIALPRKAPPPAPASAPAATQPQ
jgi:spermidine synthase